MIEKVENPELAKRMRQLFQAMKTTQGPIVLSEVDQAIIALHIADKENAVVKLSNEILGLRLELMQAKGRLEEYEGAKLEMDVNFVKLNTAAVKEVVDQFWGDISESTDEEE